MSKERYEIPEAVLTHYLKDLFLYVDPDLVFYDAGVDPHRDDVLGKLCLTNTGLYRREMQVLTTCVDAGYPVACVIGGGYANTASRKSKVKSQKSKVELARVSAKTSVVVI